MEPIKPEEIRLTIVARKQLVWVTRKQNGDALSTVRLPTFQYSLPVFVAKIRDNWVIAR
jgi:hypothetical protein